MLDSLILNHSSLRNLFFPLCLLWIISFALSSKFTDSFFLVQCLILLLILSVTSLKYKRIKNNCWFHGFTWIFLFLLFLFLSSFLFHTVQLVESQFPDQGLKWNHGSEKSWILTTRSPGNSQYFLNNYFSHYYFF